MLSEKSCPLTAFRFEHQQFQFKRLPFGLVSSVAIFIYMMNTLFGLETDSWMKIYCDTKSFDEHLRRLEKNLHTFMMNGLTLKLRKCKLAQRLYSLVISLMAKRL